MQIINLKGQYLSSLHPSGSNSFECSEIHCTNKKIQQNKPWTKKKIKPEKLIWLLDLRKVIQNEGFIMGKLLNA